MSPVIHRFLKLTGYTAIIVGALCGTRYLQDSGLLQKYTGINLDNYPVTRFILGNSFERKLLNDEEGVTYSFYKKMPDGLYMCWCEFSRCTCGVHDTP